MKKLLVAVLSSILVLGGCSGSKEVKETESKKVAENKADKTDDTELISKIEAAKIKLIGSYDSNYVGKPVDKEIDTQLKDIVITNKEGTTVNFTANLEGFYVTKQPVSFTYSTQTEEILPETSEPIMIFPLYEFSQDYMFEKGLKLEYMSPRPGEMPSSKQVQIEINKDNISEISKLEIDQETESSFSKQLDVEFLLKDGSTIYGPIHFDYNPKEGKTGADTWRIEAFSFFDISYRK